MGKKVEPPHGPHTLSGYTPTPQALLYLMQPAGLHILQSKNVLKASLLTKDNH